MCCSYACSAWAWCAVIRRRQCPQARTAASWAVSCRSRAMVSASSASSCCSRAGWRWATKNVLARPQAQAASHSASRPGQAESFGFFFSAAASAG